ncbi:Hypothetical predicted protein [Lecanosticta acicola]|uniref:Uncharacterized protein n=1 Tax=Lecanosticta acicola TaxID=111012 RepID=A0AAI8YUL1_9PEZI|nr:Hypothetical predicted protein [Lecanosticta acicola]
MSSGKPPIQKRKLSLTHGISKGDNGEKDLDKETHDSLSKAGLDAYSTAPPKGHVLPITDPLATFAKGSGTGGTPQNLPGHSGASGRSGASGSNLTSTNNVEPSASEDDIHRTVRTKYDPDSMPTPRPNYFWSSDRPIEDLEAYIGSLQARRQQLAREAEILWARLSEKEAEYYNSPEANTPPPQEEIDKPAKVVYIETLSILHRKAWKTIGYFDWMIRHSQKRIEQVRSAQSNPDGKVTWRAEAGAETKPRITINRLKGVEEGVSARLAHLQQIYGAVAMSMAAPDWDSSEEGNALVFSPFKNKMMPQREAIMELRNETEKAIRVLQREVDIAKAVIRDLEAGGKESSKEKD